MLAGSADEQRLEPSLAGPPQTGWTVGGRQLKPAASQWTWAQENMHFNSWNLCNILKPFSLLAICVALCLCLHGGDLFRKGKKTDIWAGHLATPRRDSGNKVSYLSPRALTPKSVWCGPIWVGGHCRGVGVTPEAKGRSWLLSRRSPGGGLGVPLARLWANSATSGEERLLKEPICCWSRRLHPSIWGQARGLGWEAEYHFLGFR